MTRRATLIRRMAARKSKSKPCYASVRYVVDQETRGSQDAIGRSGARVADRNLRCRLGRVRVRRHAAKKSLSGWAGERLLISCTLSSTGFAPDNLWTCLPGADLSAAKPSRW